MKLLSIVIPVYNEEQSLPALFSGIRDNLSSIPNLDFEAILVDDGSTDDSWRLIQEQQRKDLRFGGLSLSRNFGHQAAITAGLDKASGDAVVVMDADLQDPPELLPLMVREWLQGHDIVYGQRRRREGESALKLLTARWFYKLMGWLSSTPTARNTGDFYLLSNRALKQLRTMRERHRYLRGMVFWLGFSPKAIPYQRASRARGRSKFGIGRMLRFALDGLLSSSSVPLYLASYMGLACALLGALLALWTIFEKLSDPQAVLGWASTMVTILFLGGVQLATIGILGIYLGHVYDETKGRPIYVVDRESLPASHARRSPRR